LSVAVHPADIQDRDGAALVLNKATRAMWPFIVKIFADAGYQGPRAALAAKNSGSWIIEVVKRTEMDRFVVLPKRWIVNVYTMLPVRAFSGHRSSNAGGADGVRD
jgi:transposase